MFGFSVVKRIRTFAVLIAACCLTGAVHAKEIIVAGSTLETTRAADAPFMFPSGPGPVMHGNFPPRPMPGLGDSQHPASHAPLTAGDGPILPDFGLGTTFEDINFNTLGSSGQLSPIAHTDVLFGSDPASNGYAVQGDVPGPGALPLIALGAMMARRRRRRS